MQIDKTSISSESLSFPVEPQLSTGSRANQIILQNDIERQEQKKSLDSLRAYQDSVSTLIKKETRNAEKELRQILEAETPDSLALSQAKKNLLDLQEKALNHRIQGKSGLSKILTAEQKVKMQEFHKNFRNKKFNREQKVQEPVSK